jgi:hypothetical protein
MADIADDRLAIWTRVVFVGVVKRDETLRHDFSSNGPRAGRLSLPSL